MTRRNMTALVAMTWTLLCVDAFAKPAAERIAVHLAPIAEAAFVDETTDGLRAAHAAVDRILRRDKLVSIVETADAADVVIVVRSAEAEDVGAREATLVPRLGYDAMRTRVDRRPVVRLGLTAGAYDREFVGGGGPYVTTVKLAAGDAAYAVREWIKDNHVRLLGVRTPR